MQGQKGGAMKNKRIGMIMVLLLIICSFLVIGLSFFGGKKKEYTQNSIVKNILEMEGLEKCKLLNIEKYDDIEYNLKIPDISEDDVKTEILSENNDVELSQLTDAYVLDNHNCNTVKEYYDKVYDELIKKEKVDMLIATRQKVINRLIELSDFYIDEDVAVEYCMDIIYGYEQEAMLYNMRLEEYCTQVLKVSYDDFFDKCYEEGERLIKIYLVVGAISELEGIEISEYKEEKDIYLQYQELENEVYGLFIKAETGF